MSEGLMGSWRILRSWGGVRRVLKIGEVCVWGGIGL